MPWVKRVGLSRRTAHDYMAVATPDMPAELMSDTYTAKTEAQPLHHWQQPLQPFVFWLGRLLKPRGTAADPFAGSGTVGVACAELQLKYIGTEIDRDTFRIARGRLVGHRADSATST